MVVSALGGSYWVVGEMKRPVHAYQGPSHLTIRGGGGVEVLEKGRDLLKTNAHTSDSQKRSRRSVPE